MYKLILASKNVSITDEKLYFYRQNESGIVHNIDFEGINDYMMFVNERYLVLKNIIDKESLDSAIRNSYFFVLKQFIKSKYINDFNEVKKLIKIEKQFFSQNKIKYKKIILYLLSFMRFRVVFFITKTFIRKTIIFIKSH